MGLGIKTAIRRRLNGPHVNPDYVEARRLAELASRPAGETLPAPAEGADLSVAFVVPSFSRGSGGHTTIANLVRALEARGTRCSIWIDDAGSRMSPSTAAAQLRDWFGPFEAEVSYGVHELASGRFRADLVAATGWQTAYTVRTLPAAGRAYLVQDHEPEFFGTSFQREYADRSYSFGLYPITAGRWLADVMDSEYGLAASSFDLGIEGELYRPVAGVPREPDTVLAYARWATPRRAVPVVLAALAELKERRPQTEVLFFGQPGDVGADFPHTNLGTVSASDLPRLYSRASVGLVLSMTNYSLVPQEMLACGLPCVELASPSVLAAFGLDGPIDTAELDPVAIADALERLFSDDSARQQRAIAGDQLRSERTWERAAEQVLAGMQAAVEHTQRSQSAQ